MEFLEYRNDYKKTEKNLIKQTSAKGILKIFKTKDDVVVFLSVSEPRRIDAFNEVYQWCVGKFDVITKQLVKNSCGYFNSYNEAKERYNKTKQSVNMLWEVDRVSD
jgi:N-acetylglucosamine kinase-like BadF-type ATPase